MLYERVMLLGCSFGQWLEPVRVMRHAILRSPLFHAYSDSIGHAAVQTGTVVNDVKHLLVDLLGQVLIHLLAVKHFLSKILGGTLRRCFYVKRLLLESLSDNLKS